MRPSRVLACLVACVVMSEHSLAQCTLPPTPKLVAPDGVTGAGFGFSVDASGSRLLVGAPWHPGGAAYLFENQGGTWNFVHKFSETGIGAAGFGHAVSIDGDRVAIGGPNTGAVYVYDFDGQNWVGAGVLVPSNPALAFGTCIDLHGSRIAIGSPNEIIGANGIEGAAYVFDRVAGQWQQTARLVGVDPSTSSSLGHSIAFEGNLVVTGAPNASGATPFPAGAAYVFSDASGAWSQTGKLFAVDYPTTGSFGLSVSVDAGRVAVGAGQYLRAHTFEQIGPFWLQTATILAPDFATGNCESISLQGNRLLLSTHRQDQGENKAGGAAYLWKKSGGSWSLDVKVWQTPPNGGGFFGWSSALSGDTIAVGAYDDNGNAFKSGTAFALSAAASTAALPPPEYGNGCAGSGGFVPVYDLPLSLNGCFAPGSSVSFSLADCLGGSTGVIFYGVSTSSVPMSGGCSLLLSPSPLVLVVPVFGSGAGNGSLVFSASIPSTVPALSVYSQAFIADPGVPHGFAATNGLRVTITP